MGFLAPAVPWIVKGGAALGASLLGRKAQSSAMQRSPEEQTALTGAQNAATGLRTTGANLVGQGQQNVSEGMGAMGGARNYWQTLLSGNRAAMSQATAGARAGVTDIYRGAERGLERSNVRGAQRDVAKSELTRERASKIAGLTTGVQPFAAQQLGDIGSTQAQVGAQTTGQGGNLLAQSGDLFSSLLGQGAANRRYGRQEGATGGSSIGSFLFDLIAGMRGGKSALPTTGSRSLTSGMGWAPKL